MNCLKVLHRGWSLHRKSLKSITAPGNIIYDFQGGDRAQTLQRPNSPWTKSVAETPISSAISIAAIQEVSLKLERTETFLPVQVQTWAFIFHDFCSTGVSRDSCKKFALALQQRIASSNHDKQWLKTAINIAPDQSYGYWNEVHKKETFMYFEIYSCLHFGVSQKSLIFYSLSEGEYRTSAASIPARWNSTWQISLLATLGTTIKHFLVISEKKNQNNWLSKLIWLAYNIN